MEDHTKILGRVHVYINHVVRINFRRNKKYRQLIHYNIIFIHCNATCIYRCILGWSHACIAIKPILHENIWLCKPVYTYSKLHVIVMLLACLLNKNVY